MCALFRFRSFSSPLAQSPQPFSRLGIRQKICIGYALSLSIAVCGTVSGFAIGEVYSRRAIEQKQLARQEHDRLMNLRSTIMEFRPVQEYASSLRRPTVFEQARIKGLSRVREVRSRLQEVQSSAMQSSIVPYATILHNYAGAFENWAIQYETLLKRIDSDSLSVEEARVVRQRLAELSASPQFARLIDFVEELRVLVAAAKDIEDKAVLEVQACERLRIEVAVFSLVLSSAIAVALAFYISGAIARPLQAATRIAQKVTQNSDFSLRVAVTTEDETGVLATTLNQLIERVSDLLEEQKRETIRQVQNEKLSSLGQMVAGVAHEINNPVNFIAGNLVPTRQYIEDLFALLEAYESDRSKAEIQNLKDDIDVEFLQHDLPKLLQSMETGIDRVKEIALSLKNFARTDNATPHPVNLHDCLDSTLMILNNRLKMGITVTRNYGEIPTVEGFSGSLYQVFMNLLSNAIDALQDHPNPCIEITTEQIENIVRISISDNGAGIAPQDLERIFEAFYTTKPIGVGTGLGLAITQQIVVEKHAGRLSCTSEEGNGTTFIVELPLVSSLQLVAQR